MVYGLLCITVIVIIALSFKIFLMRRSAVEIAEAFADRLKTDTNTLIDISSRDKKMCALADSINRELKILRREHHRYTQGDKELKSARSAHSAYGDLRLSRYDEKHGNARKNTQLPGYYSQQSGAYETADGGAFWVFRYTLI